jgi:hypothetical protein
MHGFGSGDGQRFDRSGLSRWGGRRADEIRGKLRGEDILSSTRVHSVHGAAGAFAFGNARGVTVAPADQSARPCS